MVSRRQPPVTPADKLDKAGCSSANIGNMNLAYQTFLLRVEREPIGVLTSQEASELPDGLFAELVNRGVLRRVYVPASCDQGVADSPCPEESHQWQCEFPRLADWLARNVGMTGEPVPVVAKCMYLLGNASCDGRSREIFFGRFLSSAIGYDYVMADAARLRAAKGAVLIMPACMLVPGLWPILRLKVITLATPCDGMQSSKALIGPKLCIRSTHKIPNPHR